MIFLKSGIGAKIALGALGLVLGIGGITAGAKWHAANANRLGNQRLYIGRIVNLNDATMTFHTASGATLNVTLLPRTTIRFRGKTLSTALLRPGDRLLLRVMHGKQGAIYALFIMVLKEAPTTQGP